MSKKVISQTRCAVVRECNHNQCVFKMYFLGYKTNPVSDFDKRKNVDLERTFGKGQQPRLNFVSRGEFIDVQCASYREKK